MTSKGREPKSCFGRVFNFKLGCIVKLLSASAWQTNSHLQSWKLGPRFGLSLKVCQWLNTCKMTSACNALRVHVRCSLYEITTIFMTYPGYLGWHDTKRIKANWHWQHLLVIMPAILWCDSAILTWLGTQGGQGSTVRDMPGTCDCTCLGHLGWCNTDRIISICQVK